METSKKLVYTTNDGKVFIDRVEAANHELKDSLTILIDDLGWGKGGEWSASMLIDSMIKEHYRFQQIYNEFDKNLHQPYVENPTLRKY